METTSLIEVIGRTSAIYAVLFVALRALGKREVSQFTPFDLVLLLTLANAVQNAMVGSNTSLAAGIAAGLTLLGVNFILGRILARKPRLRHWVEGTPTLLVRHGKVEWPAMRRENVDLESLQTALREHGLSRIQDVELAVLELDGSVSIVGPHGSTRPRSKGKRRVSKGATWRPGA